MRNQFIGFLIIASLLVVSVGATSNLKRKSNTAITLGTEAVAPLTTGTPSVYFQCTKPANDAAWTYYPSFSTIYCAGTKDNYLGSYGARGTVNSPTFSVPAHKGVTVSLELAFIDSWDGESFKVLADNAVVYQDSHNVQTQSFSNTCGNGWNDAYSSVLFGFNHTAATLSLVFTSTLDQVASDESWGICDVTITPTLGQVLANGTQIIPQEFVSTTPTVFFPCSNPAKDIAWSYYPAYSTITCKGTGYTYVGPYGAKGTVTSPALTTSDHQGVIVSLKLAFIDSWDGEAFKVFADGALAYQVTHSVLTQSFSNTCGNGWNDAYDSITFGFNHTASTLTLKITSTLDQDASDESWGVCDLTITLSNFNVQADGTEITTQAITAPVTTWFACANPVVDAIWTYYPAYSTIKCAGTGYTYLGPYGSKGTVTSPKFTIAAAHNGIIVAFKLAFIDSWDGEAFKVFADGALIYQVTHNFLTQSFSNTCGSGFNDAYASVLVGFNHTATTLNLLFTSTLDQPAADEAWGICDLTVTLSTHNVLATGAEITTEAIDGQTTWFPCSNAAQDMAWSYYPAYSTITCKGTGYTYVGPYGQQGAVTSPTLTIAAAHNGIIVAFKLAFIDSWDGEAFKVFADGALAYQVTHNFQTQSSSNTCGNGWNDAYDSVTFGFNHTAPTLTLKITSTLDQPASDESWGVCDLTVTLSNFNVNADGTEITTQALTTPTTTWFACANPVVDTVWTYYPAFSTIKCAGTGYTYVGPYGAKGAVTSPKFTTTIAHNGIIVSFKLAFIDSWDGEAFKVFADGALVYQVTHNFQTQSFSNTCGNGWNDAYAGVTIGFNHTALTLTLLFTSTLDQVASDESWGVCDLSITLSDHNVLATGVEITTQAITTKTTNWFACTNPAVDSAWTYYPTFTTIKCAGTGYTYVGPYGAKGTVTSPSFTVGPAHQGIVVSFKLAWIDSWDGEAFKVLADNALIYQATHNFQTQSFSNTCGNGWNDAYNTVTVGFNHTAPTLALVFTSTLDQPAADEAWGICDLAITLSDYNVLNDGTEITTEAITDKTTTWFACSNPVVDSIWSYSPAYSTIKCAGTGYTYIGPYGAKGAVTSPTFTIGLTHQGIIVSLRLAWIDSWDGEAFKISADGKVVFTATHNFQTQSYSNTCGNGWNDAYSNITFGFNHTANTLNLIITSTLDQVAADEAWGICDFTITLSDHNVNADGTEITTEAINTKTTIFFACSNPVVDTFWTYVPAYSTITCKGTGYTYVGPYGAKGAITSPKFTTTVPHQGVVVSVKLAWIDSWDGEAFKITADGALVYSATHSVLSQSFSNTCGNGWNDAYNNITFGFNHTSYTLNLYITSTLDQPAADEAWGICDLTITFTDYQVTSDGVEMVIRIPTISDTPTVFFPCVNPVIDFAWTYNPSFSTIKCAGTGYTYVGPYGAKGAVTSPAFIVGGHRAILVSFKLAWIDSWDGEAFRISADGTLVYSATHSVLSQSFSNTCGNGWNDAYSNVTFGFNHTADKLTLVITSTLDQAAADEAWGVCDLTISTSQFQVQGDGTAITSESLTDRTTNWFACSNPAIDSLWAYSPAFSTVTCKGTGYTYLGPFGSKGTVTSPKFLIGLPHNGVIISFKLAWIDSWDGEAFRITADGTLVYSATHNFITQSFSNSCGNGWNDAYNNVTFGFNHTANTLTLAITSTLDQVASDESWGICDFSITLSDYQVTDDGTEMIVKDESITATPQVWFSCANPAADYAWTYSPSYSTVKCAGTGFTYLGAYGSKGTVTSPIFTVGHHRGILVSFKLAWIDSWDGEAFRISADGTLVYSATHSVLSQSFSNTCGNGWNDAYSSITFGFNHTASTLTLVITSTLDQVASDESWGICDLTISSSQYYLQADGTAVTTETITGKTTTWFACADPDDDPLWTYAPAWSTITCKGTGYTYLGPYGARGTVTSPKFQIGFTHQGIIASFKLAWIDSWDGEAFRISADAALVYSATHNFQTQSFSNSCGNGWNDAYNTVTFGFNHSATTLTLVITSTLNQDAADESWGICDFTLTLSDYQVTVDGTEMITKPESVSAKPTVWFPCANPTQDFSWSYTPAFSTIKCAGTGYTYVGPYGSKGSVTSPVFTVDEHSGIIVSLKLAFIDSWDGEAFRITADGTLVYSATHSVLSQSFSNTCGNGWNDAYSNVTFGFNHTADTLTLVITSTLDQAAADESWGVCDLTVSSSENLVTPAGQPIQTESIGAQPTVWFACANNKKDNLWAYNPAYSTIKCAGTGFTYLGAYGSNGAVTSPAFAVDSHNGIIVSFKLAWIDSWDGEAFRVYADNALVYSATHNFQTQSFSNSCGNGWNDAYSSITFGFNHTAVTLTLKITSTLDQAASDESWGVCDFTVSTSEYTVQADGTPITTETITEKTTTWFACSNTQPDNAWTYNPSFSTIKCAGTGNTYLGPYGQGGVVTSAQLLIQLPHKGIIVSFKLAWIDSWDGEAFKIKADSTLVYAATHNFRTESTSNSCQSSQWPDAYANVLFGFNHTAKTLTLQISSTLDQSAADEAWGVCDFTLTLSNYQVLNDGSELIDGNITPVQTIYFPCSNPVNQQTWTYSPKYTTIKCAGTGNTYVGPYGAAGYVVSPKFNVDSHKGIVVSFKIAWLDSWDGEAFTVTADGQTVYSATHNFQTKSTANTCGSGWGDDYGTVTFGFNHTASSLTLKFSSTLNQAAADEAWGICDLAISSSQNEVTADGSELSCYTKTVVTTVTSIKGGSHNGEILSQSSTSSINYRRRLKKSTSEKVSL